MLMFAAMSAVADHIGSGPFAFAVGAFAAAYLLGADAFNLGPKRLFGLEVIDASTGARCSWFQSTARCIPWWIGPFAKDVFAEDRVAMTVIFFVSLVITVSLWRKLGDGSGRHWADRMTGTAVQPAGRSTRVQ
jgi:hypothetical protein